MGPRQVDDRLAVGHGHHERTSRHGGNVVMHHGAARLDHAHVEVLFADGRAAVDDHGVSDFERFVKGAFQLGRVVVHDGEHERFGAVFHEQMLHHEAVGVHVLPATRFDAGGHQFAAGGNEGHARLAAHGHHGRAAHGERGQVGGADGHPGLHEGRALLQGGAGRTHAASRLDLHVVVKHHRSVRLDGRFLDHDDGVEVVGEVVAGVSAHVVHAELPAAGVRQAVRKGGRLHGDAVERRGAHDGQRVGGHNVARQHAPHRFVEGHQLFSAHRLPGGEEVGERFLAGREPFHDLLSHRSSSERADFF